MNHGESLPAYSMERAELETVFTQAADAVRARTRWNVLSRALLPSIAREFRMEGLDLLPPSPDPCIIISNHPSHMDYFIAGAAMEGRPDMRMVARVPLPQKEKFSERTFFLTYADAFLPLQSEANGGYVRKHLAALIQSVKSGVSIILVPWGCMDHEAGKECPPERAVENVLRLARHVNSPVLPAHIDIQGQAEQWPGPLPFQSVSVTLRASIHPDNEQDVDAAVRRLYAQSVR